MMYYISKGMAYRTNGTNNVHISRCGGEYTLNGSQAKLWLAGRFRVARAKSAIQRAELEKLDSMGLVEVTEPDAAAAYRLLTNCVICTVTPAIPRLPLNQNEKLIWTWLKNAGFKLTVSELVFLAEQNIMPSSAFFGEDNWHNLIHAIYTTETIFDRILDAKMEESPVRDRTVSAVIGLLRKKRIILV